MSSGDEGISSRLELVPGVRSLACSVVLVACAGYSKRSLAARQAHSSLICTLATTPSLASRAATLRGVALGRKKFMFAGNKGGGPESRRRLQLVRL